MVILVNLNAITHYNTLQQITLQFFLTMHLVNLGQLSRIFGHFLVNRALFSDISVRSVQIYLDFLAYSVIS